MARSSSRDPGGRSKSIARRSTVDTPAHSAPGTPDSDPNTFELLGRNIGWAILVGVLAGLVGAGFFWILDRGQDLLLVQLAGYRPLRATGERLLPQRVVELRWLALVLVPAIGGLLAGLVSRLAPEVRGGGGNAYIDAFHHHDGRMRPRVIPIKALASLLTLGSGGAGGREGPTMQIGGAIGSLLGRGPRATPGERRTLVVAGVAAGIAAVFRTPLGAALLAIEVLYRDDFEAEALVPAVLASVVSYSVVISLYGESTLFGVLPRFAFHPAQLPLFAAMALAVALAGRLFVGLLRMVERGSARLPMPDWQKPMVGGLVVGFLIVPVLWWVGERFGVTRLGMAVLGAGYGGAQMALTGRPELPGGWLIVELFLLLALAKMVAAAFTIGTGGSAGDFGPSLVIGGFVGGAFGHAARLLLGSPAIEPGAYALVGMGCLYAGIAHVPLAALVLVCEMAGSYDLLVPLMLAVGISFLVQRRVKLYDQPASRRDSPVHRVAP